MTEKQKNKVSEMAKAIMVALDVGHVVMDEDGNEVLGLRFNAKMNPGTWCYLYDGKTGHLVHGAIRYKALKAMNVSSKFTVLKDGKKPTTIK